MSVTVTTGTERRSWRLLAEDGDGPFIPGVAARALLRRSRVILIDEEQQQRADAAQHETAR